MYGSQPETQMLQLWSNHRRPTAYAMTPVTERTTTTSFRGWLAGLIAWGIILGGTVILLTGCVAHYPAYGYDRGYGRAYGHHHHHSDRYGGYRAGDWHYRGRHHDDD